MRPVAALNFLFLFAVFCSTHGHALPEMEVRQPSFVKVEGRHLVHNGRPIKLRAINFSNFYFMNITTLDLLESPHHSDVDFKRVRELGFNAVRFAFKGDWYIQDRHRFFKWLDRNVAMAAQHRVYLILDLHIPVGSFWLDPTKPAVFDIWHEPHVQRDNIEMWRDIAERYRDQEIIAAFDVLNEPVTTDTTGQQWRDLAAKLVKAVRDVDANHVIVVGALYGTEGRYGMEGRERHFLVDDTNIVYDFHFYEPIRYTHQSAKWLERPTDDGGKYPDAKILLPTGDHVLLPHARISTRSVANGDSEWRVYDSGPIRVTDDAAIAGLPIATVRGPVRGTVYIDDVAVLEYDKDGNLLGEVARDPLDEERVLHWYAWSEGGDTKGFQPVDDRGANDRHSLSIVGSESNKISGWSSDDNFFAVTAGHSYRIVGKMKGVGVHTSDGTEPAGVRLEIDFYRNPDGVSQPAFIGRTKKLLEHKMKESLDFGLKHNVPMSVMEFGVIATAFKRDRGGAAWLKDMIELLEQHTVAYAYWEYHGDTMGLFVRSAGGFEFTHPPIRPNQRLVDAIESALKPKAP